MHTEATASKYRTLREASTQGIQTIPTLYIRANTPATQAAISEFIHTQSASLYLVRSAVVAEDGIDRSYAGMFYTAPPVSPAMVMETITAVQRENTHRANKLGLVTAPHVMLCPYIETTYGGVTFAPWLYFHQHCVTEWAESAEAAVAGQTLGTTAVDIHSGETIPILGTMLPTAVAKALASTIKQLRQIFSHPMDVEWGYDGTQLYVFQIRPITIAPTAFTPSTAPIDPTLTFDQYSDAFGKLSPLSYSLFSTLYKRSALYYQTLGVQGKHNFLYRLPTGEIATDDSMKKQYFRTNRWFTSILRPTRIALTLKQTIPPTATDALPTLEELCTAFSLWQLASFVAGQSDSFAEPHEYEITHQLDLSRYPTHSTVAKYKRDFLALTLPIRARVREVPQYSWGTIEDALSGQLSPTWSEEYTAELSHSFVSARASQAATHNKLLWGTPVNGPHIHITNPLAWHNPLPTKTIISTPFIPAHWILELPNLTGVICCSMTQLSHSAITLRECNIPTLLVTEPTLLTLTEKNDVAMSELL